MKIVYQRTSSDGNLSVTQRIEVEDDTRECCVNGLQRAWEVMQKAQCEYKMAKMVREDKGFSDANGTDRH